MIARFKYGNNERINNLWIKSEEKNLNGTRL